jgi:hypothetical protein
VSRFVIVFILQFVYFFLPASAQVDTGKADTGKKLIHRVDSLPRKTTIISIKDSLPGVRMKDSFTTKPATRAVWPTDSSLPLNAQILQHHPYFGFSNAPITSHISIHQSEGKETIFYVLVGILLLFAFLRSAFAKYLNDLFRLFFRTTLKQRQIRDQLMQTPLPSLLFNGFFIVSGSLYTDYMLVHFGLVDKESFWIYFFYCCVGISMVYLVKFLGLKVLGWIFNMPEIADSYIFIVFIINKVIGIFLLPFLVMLAFMEGTAFEIALVASWIGIAALICYRFILTYAAVRNQVKFNPFHFFLYLCAFEIAPLLLIYKVLLVFFQ